MDALLAVFGRCHPLLLHVPIGLLVGLLALEALAVARRTPLQREVAGALVWLAALSALLVAASGWTLARESGYVGRTLAWHRWLGVSVASCTTLAALAHGTGRHGLYRGLLALCAPLLVLAGHRGSILTHGAGFLTEPLRERAPSARAEAVPEPPVVAGAETPAPPAAAHGPSWSRDVAPVLEAKCWRCHGPDKHKGDLALHTPAALLAGGETGPAIVPGEPQSSALIARVTLPLDDMDHMPPEGKPQPSAEEIELLRAWIAAGAAFDVPLDAGPAPSAGGGEQADDDEEDDDSSAAPRPDAQALAALGAELVHVEELPAGSGALWIDFAATAEQIDDAALRRLLEPLREHAVELSLARTRTGDASAAFLAGFPRLRRLDLRSTAITDAGVTALAGSASLAELVLAQTAVGDGAVDALVRMPALERLWLWQSAVGAEGLARLQSERPALRVDDGATPDAAALEIEGEPVLTSDRPVPGAPAAQAADLAPVNARCPVSGEPVDPTYSIVHEGRVIGFCCPDCPKAFWDDPAKFAPALD